MSTSSTLIILAGVGAAAWLYYRSQQAQAAALAAAQANPGPGFVGKLENNVKDAAKAFPSTVKNVLGLGLRVTTPVTSKITSTASTAGHDVYGAVKSAVSAPVNLVKGIF